MMPSQDQMVVVKDSAESDVAVSDRVYEVFGGLSFRLGWHVLVRRVVASVWIWGLVS